MCRERRFRRQIGSEKSHRKIRKKSPEESEKLPGRIRKVVRKNRKSCPEDSEKVQKWCTQNLARPDQKPYKTRSRKRKKNHRKIRKKSPEDSKKYAGRFKKIRRKIQKFSKIGSENCQKLDQNFFRVGFQFCVRRCWLAIYSADFSRVQNQGTSRDAWLYPPYKSSNPFVSVDS